MEAVSKTIFIIGLLRVFLSMVVSSNKCSEWLQNYAMHPIQRCRVLEFHRRRKYLNRSAGRRDLFIKPSIIVNPLAPFKVCTAIVFYPNAVQWNTHIPLCIPFRTAQRSDSSLRRNHNASSCFARTVDIAIINKYFTSRSRGAHMDTIGFLIWGSPFLRE